MKFRLTIIFLFYWSFGFCQSSPLSAHKLTKLFKESIDQESKKSISIGSGAWTICNQDNAFFKADTIILYSNCNYFYQLSNCCNLIEWTFYKKNAFVQSTSQICKEPASSSTSTEYYKIDYFSDHQILYFSVWKKGSVETFEVLSLQKIKLADNNFTMAITLKRLFTHKPLIGSVH
jgi:hypothetical protein